MHSHSLVILGCKVDTFAVKVKILSGQMRHMDSVVGHLHVDGRVTVLYLYVDIEGPFIYILGNYGSPYQELHGTVILVELLSWYAILCCYWAVTLITVFTNSCI